jgi:hypothetical protein
MPQKTPVDICPQTPFKIAQFVELKNYNWQLFLFADLNTQAALQAVGKILIKSSALSGGSHGVLVLAVFIVIVVLLSVFLTVVTPGVDLILVALAHGSSRAGATAAKSAAAGTGTVRNW